MIVKEIVSEEDFYLEFDHHDGLIVDIRDSSRRSQKFIEGAVNQDLMSEHFIEFFSTVSKDRPILLYCENGTRSKIAVRLLEELGFSDLYILKNGIASWDLLHF